MSDFDLIQSGTHKRKSRSGERLEEVFRLHGEQSSPAVKKAEQKPTLLQNYQYLCVAVLAIGISSILILTTVCLIGKRMHHDEVKLNTVHKCPQNKAEWKDREREFKCPEINKAHVYHCVLDSKGTKLLEVCAPVVNIQGGRCTAFDISRHTIQESSISCSDTCPNEYKSSDAYLYQSCYEQVYETEHRNTKFSLINHHYGLRSLGTVNMILVGLLLLLLIIIILQKIMSFYCKMDDNKEINEEIASDKIFRTSKSSAVNSRIYTCDANVHRPWSAEALQRASTFDIKSDWSSFFQEPSDYSCRFKKTTFDERAKHNYQELNIEEMQIMASDPLRVLDFNLVETKTNDALSR
uniref:Uncharacterized protein LOC111114603 isoform X4 n=1 Tax=Crassostrea virginica TaxID=6565 RepID=A0A8B8C0R7_CRAVI|nr:uncharacterized protein LOC111114603 isoform X4 [Crassostrea virginica]